MSRNSLKNWIERKKRERKEQRVRKDTVKRIRAGRAQYGGDLQKAFRYGCHSDLPGFKVLCFTSASTSYALTDAFRTGITIGERRAKQIRRGSDPDLCPCQQCSDARERAAQRELLGARKRIGA